MVNISFIIPMIHSYPEIYSTVNNIQTEMLDSPYQWEIIVAENGTVDPNTPHAFTGAKALYRYIMRTQQLKYVFEPRQCGPVARNTGAHKATGKYVMFMDAQTTLGKNTVSPLVEYMEDHPEIIYPSFVNREFFETAAGGGITVLSAYLNHFRRRKI